MFISFFVWGEKIFILLMVFNGGVHWSTLKYGLLTLVVIYGIFVEGIYLLIFIGMHNFNL